jgi:phosphatidylserine decarboxylase
LSTSSSTCKMACSTSLTVSFASASVILLLAAASLLFYRFYFLRRPARKIPQGSVVVSPADGRIVRILDIRGGRAASVSKGLLGKVRLLTADTIRDGHVIVIMMTPFNVHYQRAPLDGIVESVRYSKGRFLNAVNDAGSLRSLQNERNEVLISTKAGRVKVVQVAGFLARRIRCFIKPKQKIHKGEEIGLICLGSQVILIIPKLRLAVKEGQRVTDGETVIARF